MKPRGVPTLAGAPMRVPRKHGGRTSLLGHSCRILLRGRKAYTVSEGARPIGFGRLVSCPRLPVRGNSLNSSWIASLHLGPAIDGSNRVGSSFWDGLSTG